MKEAVGDMLAVVACRRRYERRNMNKASIKANTKGIETPRNTLALSESPPGVGNDGCDVPNALGVPCIADVLNAYMFSVSCEILVAPLVDMKALEWGVTEDMGNGIVFSVTVKPVEIVRLG